MKAVVKIEDLKRVVASFPKPSRVYVAPISLTAANGQVEFAMLHNNGIVKTCIPAEVEEDGKALPDPVQLKMLVRNAEGCERIELQRFGESGRLKVILHLKSGHAAEYAIFCYAEDQEPEIVLDGVEYDTTIANWTALHAQEIWNAMKLLKPFRGDALSGYGDFFVDSDNEGTLLMFTVAGAYSVAKRLPVEVAETKLPLRLPALLLDMLPKPHGDVSLFCKNDGNLSRMYLITESAELSFSVSSSTMKLPQWFKDAIGKLDSLTGFSFVDRRAMLKTLQVGKNEYKSRLAINRVARLTCGRNNSSLEVFVKDVDGFEPIASITLPPSDNAERKVALFNCDLLHSLLSSLPLVEVRLGDAFFDPNVSVLYARDPSKSLVVAVASLATQYFEELLTDETEVD